MLGYDMSWASFNVVEVMSSVKYKQKRIGYLTATHSFNEETDDLASSDYMTVSLALESLSQIVNSELAIDLLEPVIVTSYSQHSFIRKKAVLVLFKILLKFPNSISQILPVFKERIEDKDDSVISATATVICELAQYDPESYLPLAPKLYKLLNDFNSNWMVIKIIKLFNLLTPLEPRLAKKLHGPLVEIIQNTNKISLLYESINTSVCGGVVDLGIEYTNEVGINTTLAELCNFKLESFLSSNDPNLQYLGLVTLSKLQEKFPNLTIIYKPIVLLRLAVNDLSIRLRALESIQGMASRDNLSEIVNLLASQLENSASVEYNFISIVDNQTENADIDFINTADNQTDNINKDFIDSTTADDHIYRKALVNTVISMCRSNNYALVSDFDWLITVYEKLALYSLVDDVDKIISDAILDATVRVQIVRSFSVYTINTQMSNTLGTAVFIIGEYGYEHLQSHQQLTAIENIFELMIKFRVFTDNAPSLFFTSLTKLLISLFKKFVDLIDDDSTFALNEIFEEYCEDFNKKLSSITTKFISLGITGSNLDLFYNSEYWCREAGLLIWVFSVIKLNFYKFYNKIKTTDLLENQTKDDIHSIETLNLNVCSLQDPFAEIYDQKLSTNREIDNNARNKATNINEMTLLQLSDILLSAFNLYELKPMSLLAQSKIEPPEDLLLTLDFNCIENYVPNTILDLKSQFNMYNFSNESLSFEKNNLESFQGVSKSQTKRKTKRLNNIDYRYYIGSNNKNHYTQVDTYDSSYTSSDIDCDQIENIPIVSLDLDLSTNEKINHSDMDFKDISKESKNLEIDTKKEKIQIVIQEDEIQISSKDTSNLLNADTSTLNPSNEISSLSDSQLCEFSLDTASLSPLLSTTLIKKKYMTLKLMEQNITKIQKDCHGNITLIAFKTIVKAKIKSKSIDSIKLLLYSNCRNEKSEIFSCKINRANDGFDNLETWELDYSLDSFPLADGLLSGIIESKTENKKYEYPLSLPILCGPLFVNDAEIDFNGYSEVQRSIYGKDCDMFKLPVKFNIQTISSTTESDFISELLRVLKSSVGINFDSTGNPSKDNPKKQNLIYTAHGSCHLNEILTGDDNFAKTCNEKSLEIDQDNLESYKNIIRIFGELEIYKFSFEIEDNFDSKKQLQQQNNNGPVNFVISIKFISASKLWNESIVNSISVLFNLN
ncbi:hypothetical protein BB561_004850 [Smittium simulii]|uniref:Clathrin/coatomer adaptor adaptin-like N-terminal domain-containing protein n=1 Tax=Smittium simulii TaxID=133385 RepID=A0A2T9YDV9_9FUNG|nr:hypothetical protein BB561_004850 [Smittium simulii]